MNTSRTNSSRIRYQAAEQNMLQTLIYNLYIAWSRRIDTNKTGSRKAVAKFDISNSLKLAGKTVVQSNIWQLKNLNRLGMVTVLVLGLTYTYFINLTVDNTAQYSAIEAQLTMAENHLSKASNQLAAAEHLLESEDGIDNANFNQAEPSGFVSRDVESVFTVKNTVGS